MARKAKRRKASTAIARRAEKFIADRKAGALVPVEPGIFGVFQRLARDPKLTVDKLAELVRLQQVIMAAEAKSAFELAYVVMQPTIPRIARNGRILNKQKELQSRYSKYEDIRRVVDPILQAHGFQLHMRTEWPETGTLEVVGSLTHRGHTRESRFRTTADASGGKNAIQGLGSGVSYGKRYTTIDLLGIVCEGQDDDGQAHGRAPRESKPVVPPAFVPPAGVPITLKERDRLVQLVKRSGRDPEAFRAWLRIVYGWESTKEITQDKYDEICRRVEAPIELLPGD